MKKLISLMIVSSLLSACATTKIRSVASRQPKAYSNYQNSYGLHIGAESYADSKEANDAFGFDLRAAGLIPVQVVIDNKSGQGVEVVSGQTFLIDSSNRYWKAFSNREAVERVQKTTEGGASISGSGKGKVTGTAPGNLLALSIGIVSGTDAGSKVSKSGSASTVSGGGNKTSEVRQNDPAIGDDVREKGIEGKIMSPEALARGYMFFPGEMTSANELRIQIKFRGDGRLQTLNLKLK